MIEARLFYDGKWCDGERTVPLLDKYDGGTVATVHEAGAEQVAAALRAVADGQRDCALAPYDRYRILARAAELVTQRRDRFVTTVVKDSGFTVSDAGREVDRAAQTLLISAEEAKRIHGEVVPFDGAPGWSGRLGFTTRHPLGVVAAITPFNSPLNTVAHKVAPAIAAGNSVIVKPASYTPLSTGLLVETLLEAGLPERLVAVVHGGGSTVGQWLLDSPIPAFYAFTGSTEVGEHLHRSVGMRRTQLELGSLSSTIICADANLERAIPLCVNAAFRKAGQVCTSVQRLYVHRAVLADFIDGLREAVTERGPSGDPGLETTFVGPVISAHDATRISDWIDTAVAAGASVVTGARREGNVLAAAMTAAGRLRMGSVHINETSSSRVDLMPYGGVKLSGHGLEGPRYAIEEMTEQRLVTFGRP